MSKDLILKKDLVIPAGTKLEYYTEELQKQVAEEDFEDNMFMALDRTISIRKEAIDHLL